MKTLILALLLIFNIYSQSWVDDWQKAVVSIGVVDSLQYKVQNQIYYKNYFRVVGTGVLFYVKIDTTSIPVLVTAKHVFYLPEENWEPKSLNLRFASDEDKPVDEYFGIPIRLQNQNQKTWIPHVDSKVDIACFLLKISDIPEISGVKVLPYSMIATNEDLYQGAKVFVLGYPGSVGMVFWTKAILREGIIAWVPPDKTHENKILIDCDIFPGNSGGPVFKVPFGVDKNGNVLSGGKIQFAGIVSQSFLSPTQVKLGNKEIIDQMGNKFHSFESIGIGVIEPSSRVTELLNMINMEIKKVQEHLH